MAKQTDRIPMNTEAEHPPVDDAVGLNAGATSIC